MERKITVGYWYIVGGPAGATVTVKGEVNPCCTVPEGGQGSFFAQAPVVIVSDDAITLSQVVNFKCAPAKLKLLGLLGGGSLPAGYLAAEFLNADIGFNSLELPLNVTNKEQEIVVRTVVQALLPTTDGEGYRSSNSTALTLGIYPGNNDDGIDGNEGIFCNLWSAGAAAIPNPGMHVAPGPYYDIGFRGHPNGNWDILFNGTTITSRTNYGISTTPYWRLFGNRNLVNRGLFGKKKSWKYWVNGKLKMDLIPCLDEFGHVCMFDVVNKTPYTNTYGTIGAGFTLPQARKLSKLPATGGTLTISLPEGYESDEGVVNALETARANGWTLTIQTYTPENATEGASTFALRRIWVRRQQDENGTYVDADGTRWVVDWCVDMLTPDGSTPDAHGYELFRSQEAAVAYWGLTPYVDPEAENLLTNQEQ